MKMFGTSGLGGASLTVSSVGPSSVGASSGSGFSSIEGSAGFVSSRLLRLRSDSVYPPF